MEYLYLDLKTLNNHNEFIWKVFIDFVKEDSKYKLIIDNTRTAKDFLNINNCIYDIYNDALGDLLMVTYFIDENQLKNSIKKIFLIDLYNLRLVQNIPRNKQIMVASLATKSELNLPKNIVVNKFILIKFIPSGLTKSINTRKILISNKSNHISKSVEVIADLKIPTKNINIKKGSEELLKKDMMLIYYGDDAHELHSLLNMHHSNDVRNINHSLNIGVNRLSFDYNVNLYNIFHEATTTRIKSLRNSILELLNTKKSSKAKEFINFSDQYQDDFQNLIKSIDLFESDEFKYVNDFNNKKIIVAIKISKYKNCLLKTNEIQILLFRYVIKTISIEKFPINHNFNTLNYLFSVNNDLLIRNLVDIIPQLYETRKNDLVLNHSIWFLAAISNFVVLNHKEENFSNSFIIKYLKGISVILKHKKSDNLDKSLKDEILLLFFYGHIVFNNGQQNEYSLWQEIKPTFSKLNKHTNFQRIDLLVRMISNQFNYTNSFSTNDYGGKTVVRNILYQVLYIKIVKNRQILFSGFLEIVNKTELKNSFDTLFKYTVFIESSNTEKRLEFNMNYNPWFECNQFYCLIFCIYIFDIIKCKEGIEVIKSISMILNFDIPNHFKDFDNDFDIRINCFENKLLEYTKEYYNFIE
jgi:hypothetical protein